MADIRGCADEAYGDITHAELLLHAVRKDTEGHVLDPIDLALPLDSYPRLHRLVNMDGVAYPSIVAPDGS